MQPKPKPLSLMGLIALLEQQNSRVEGLREEIAAYSRRISALANEIRMVQTCMAVTQDRGAAEELQELKRAELRESCKISEQLPEGHPARREGAAEADDPDCEGGGGRAGGKAGTQAGGLF